MHIQTDSEVKVSQVPVAPLRVVHVTSIHHDFDSRIWKYVTSLASAGCQVHLICPWQVAEGVGEGGIHFHPFRRVEVRGLRPFLIPFRLLRRLIPLLGHVDIVHFHDIDILPWMALLSLRIPVVYDIHENYPQEMLVRQWIPRPARVPLYHIVDWSEVLLARVIRNVVLVVPVQEARFKSERFKRIEIRNYAAEARFADILIDNYITRPDCIIYTGANYEDNGSLLLLEIAARLKVMRPNVRFLVRDVFAHPHFRCKFMEMRQAKGLEKYVELFKNVPAPEIGKVLCQATIGISPNLRISKQNMALPQKLFEYMAAALPIVCSDLQYARAILTEHPIGLLAQPEDPDSFVRALVRLVDDRPFARAMGAQGRAAFVRSFAWERQFPKLLAYYHALLEERFSPRSVGRFRENRES